MNNQVTGPTELTEPESHCFDDLDAHIAQRPYELYEKRNRVQGHNLENWFDAEHQILMEQVPEDS